MCIWNTIGVMCVKCVPSIFLDELETIEELSDLPNNAYVAEFTAVVVKWTALLQLSMRKIVF